MSEFISFLVGGLVMYALMKWQPWDKPPVDDFPTKKFPRPPRTLGRGGQ